MGFLNSFRLSELEIKACISTKQKFPLKFAVHLYKYTDDAKLKVCNDPCVMSYHFCVGDRGLVFGGGAGGQTRRGYDTKHGGYDHHEQSRGGLSHRTILQSYTTTPPHPPPTLTEQYRSQKQQHAPAPTSTNTHSKIYKL